MKRQNLPVLLALCAALVLPVMRGIGATLSMEYVLRSQAVYAALVVALCLGAAVFPGGGKVGQALAALLPISLCLSGVMAITGLRSAAVPGLWLLAGGLGCTAFFRTRMTKRTRRCWGIPAMLATLVLCLYALFAMMMADFGRTRSISALSPDGSVLAEAIEVDEGALGGAFRVEVRKNETIPLVLGRLRPAKKTLYSGRWESVGGMEIVWTDDTHFDAGGRMFGIEE